MSFLSPSAFWLSLLLPALVLLYMLKLRRQEVLVASTYLWKRSLEDLHANAPFQRLVKNLLMFAQLLALAVLVFAAAKPTLAGRLGSGRTLALLIDTSASMRSSDVAPSRLDAALAAARRLVEGLEAGDRCLLVAFGSKPRILASLTDEKAVLLAALKSVPPTDTEGSAREALLIAGSVLRGHRNASVILLGDGGASGLDAPLPDGIEVRYLKVGERARNAGITALDARPYAQEEGRYQVFVETRGTGIAQGRLSLFADGGLVDARRVAWEAGRPGATFFEVKAGADTRIRAVLDVEDDLAVDNEAFLVLSERPRRRILLVGEGNYFLERLLNLDPGYDLFTIKPAEYAAQAAAGAGGGYDLTVFDRWAPPALPPGGHLLIHAVPPIEGFKNLGTLEHPLVTDWKRAHPLMRFANFSNLQVRKAIRWEHPAWAVPLLESSGGPLILMAERGPVRAAVVGFDLLGDTDWPFRLSFPVFIHNAIRTLGGGDGTEMRGLRTGETLVVRRPPGGAAPSCTVESPDGRKVVLAFDAEGTATFADTLTPGFYAVETEGTTRHYGASLRSARETDTAPAEEGTLARAGTPMASGRAALEPRSSWGWFAVAALALLLLEWAMYHRRWL